MLQKTLHGNFMVIMRVEPQRSTCFLEVIAFNNGLKPLLAQKLFVRSIVSNLHNVCSIPNCRPTWAYSMSAARHFSGRTRSRRTGMFNRLIDSKNYFLKNSNINPISLTWLRGSDIISSCVMHKVENSDHSRQNAAFGKDSFQHEEMGLQKYSNKRGSLSGPAMASKHHSALSSSHSTPFFITIIWESCTVALLWTVGIRVVL